MKFGVITFPGSNSDYDMIYVLETIMGLKVEHLWHKEHDLRGVDFVVLPGGFSYGDYLRSGAIARFSPIMEEVVAHAKRGGYVLGVCNGFQILCEAGLTPGVLLHNDNQKYVCKNVYLKADNNKNLPNASIPYGKVLKVPIAHGEGRYYAPEDLLKQIEDNNQVLFRYVTPEGKVDSSINPNGSLNNIAGVSNAGRNVFGMMPHPERAADKELSNTDGRLIIESLLSLTPA